MSRKIEGTESSLCQMPMIVQYENMRKMAKIGKNRRFEVFMFKSISDNQNHGREVQQTPQGMPQELFNVELNVIKTTALTTTYLTWNSVQESAMMPKASLVDTLSTKCRRKRRNVEESTEYLRLA